MPKFLRTGAMLLTVAVLVCLVGFVHARVSGGPAQNAFPWMIGLAVCFAVMGLAAAYMAFVGVYHTILALFGWDGGPGILRKNPNYVPGSDEPLPDDTHLIVPEAPHELVRPAPRRADASGLPAGAALPDGAEPASPQAAPQAPAPRGTAAPHKP